MIVLALSINVRTPMEARNDTLPRSTTSALQLPASVLKLEIDLLRAGYVEAAVEHGDRDPANVLDDLHVHWIAAPQGILVLAASTMHGS